MALKVYKKNLEYSYSLGIFPTIELLTAKPNQCTTVLVDSSVQNTEGIVKIKELCSKYNINIDKADKAINKLAIKDKTQVIGVFNKYETTLDSNADHVVLVNISSPGNLGTIIRAAVGFNVKNIAIIKPASEVFNPMTIRASMGAAFRINFQYFDTYEFYKNCFLNHMPYPFVLNGNKNLAHVEFSKPAALIFGNEGEGLNHSFESFENSLTISHSSEIDSLNLATATGIALNTLYSQRYK